MEKLLAVFFSFFLGSIFVLPWVFVRKGAYKGWYLAHFVPPFIWGRAVFMWPASIFFFSIPILAALPISDDAFMNAIGIVGMVGMVLAIIMIGWTPGWAKPKWQRYLEDKYTGSEIRSTFIPVWRKMDRKKWSQLLDSEAGIEELVRIAREEKYGYP